MTRYVARHGKGRVAKAVLMSAVLPIMVKTAEQLGWSAHRSIRRAAREPRR